MRRRDPSWFRSSGGGLRALALLGLLLLLSGSGSSTGRLVRCFAAGVGARPYHYSSAFRGGASASAPPTAATAAANNPKSARIAATRRIRADADGGVGPAGISASAADAATAASDDDEDGAVPDDEEDEVDEQQQLLSPAIRGGSRETGTAALSIGPWPCLDHLDRRLIKISLPMIANFAISPLIGAVDLFWVNRMGNALAVAGQSAANQVFGSVFWLTSFLPSVSATLISQENASGNQDGVQDAVCQALFVGIGMALVSSALLLGFPEQVLGSVLQPGAAALKYAKPYLLIRSFAFVPSLISLVGFSAFRGVLETTTPVYISAFANLFNAVLDPILIFSFAMGVPGAALATLAAEVVSAATYLVFLRRRNMISFRKLVRPPKLSKLEPLLKGGAALQLRNVALNLTFLAVARVVQSIDETGVSAAAHAISIQTFQVGGIVLLALSTVAQTVVPNDLVERYDASRRKKVGGLRYAKATVNRLMCWGFLLGTALGGLQLLLLPVIRSSTPLPEVRAAATLPAILASVFQVMNGLVFIGEGVMIGTQSFFQLSISTVVATAGCLWALRTFPPRFGLTGVWIGFGVFNVIRLIGVYIHQAVYGPLSPRNVNEAEKQ